MPRGWSLEGPELEGKRPEEQTLKTLVVRDYKADEAHAGPGMRVAAFDFDDCLASTSFRGGTDPNAWSLRFQDVPEALQQLHAQRYRIVIVSNESTDRIVNHEPKQRALAKKTGRIDGFMEAVGVPCLALVAFAKDQYRKPHTGAWDYLCTRHGQQPDNARSFFVGDAAGRKKDHSDSDLLFAQNVGVRFFTEDDFFVGRQRLESEPPPPQEPDAEGRAPGPEAEAAGPAAA
jgi:bifunctional polynucleotide phosphatase/kinase